MNKSYHVYDLIACIDNDNPFPTGNELFKNNLKKYINEHPKEFIFTDNWLEEIHSIASMKDDEIINSFKGVPINQKLKVSDVKDLGTLIKGFFLQKDLPYKCSPELLKWINKKEDILDPFTSYSENLITPGANPPEINSNNENKNESNPLVPTVLPVTPNLPDHEESINQEPDTEEIKDLNTYTNNYVETKENYTPNEPNDLIMNFGRNISTINELSTYNFSSNETLSYDELCQLCINQARKSLESSKTRDIEIQKAETEQRDKLCHVIQQYFDLAEIQAEYATSKLESMTIEELQQLQKQCEMKFDMLKTKEMLKHGLDVFEIGYDALLPNGIPLGKQRRMVLDKGLTKTISNTLFDVRTVPGHAFRRILDKHHIHLSDEVTVGLEVLKLLMKNTHIVKNEDQKNIEEIEEDSEINPESSSDLIQEITY